MSTGSGRQASGSLPQSRDETPDSPSSFVFPRSRTSLERTSLDRRDNGSGNHSTVNEASRQRFVLTDPVAFRYLEEDPATTVLDRRCELSGYQCYIVEQWVTSRTHPTFIITTYTGDVSDKVIVGVLGVPIDEGAWSQRLRVYFKALNQYHARRRDTPLGIMMVTNLTGFPSSLSVIAVPEGDLRKRRADFFVNENLKRLGCSGRMGLTFSHPSGATIAKYHQLYRTSEKNPLYNSVIELVKLCQAALHIFDTLEIEYVDGLLCDMTEKAINDWWLGIGSDIYNIEPHDGILGPTTVAALLGLLMGARNRLHAVSAPVPKDPFDVEGMKRGISSFQKSQKVARNRRLDRRTLRQLHTASEKYAYSEGWSVPRAVKSTVAELSGKGGEMLADVVSRRDRAAIAEIETTDIEQLQHLVIGERGRWLWQGKALKRANTDLLGETSLEGHLILRDDHQGFTWSGRSRPTTGDAASKEPVEHEMQQSLHRTGDGEVYEQEDNAPKIGVIKRATELLHEGRSGIGRIKDAVTHLGHQSRLSKDDTYRDPSHTEGVVAPRIRPMTRRSMTSPTSPTSPQLRNGTGTEDAREPHQRSEALKPPVYGQDIFGSPVQSETNLIPGLGRLEERSMGEDTSLHPSPAETPPRTPLEEPIYHGVDIDEKLPIPEDSVQDITPLLRRTHSMSAFVDYQAPDRVEVSQAQLRHLSFSVAADSVLPDSSGINDFNDPSSSSIHTADQQLAYEHSYTSHLQRLRVSLRQISVTEAAWTKSQLTALSALQEMADSHQMLLDDSREGPSRAAEDMKNIGVALLRDEKDVLDEGRRELESLAAKLEYELGGLKGKIEDVEIGVKDFERAVEGVEQRVEEVKGEWESLGRWSCVVS